MKKRTLCLLAAGIAVLTPLSASAGKKDDRIAELEAQVAELESEVASLKEQLSQYEPGSESAGMEQYLLDLGLLEGDRIQLAAEMIGAESGFKYGQTEIYEYDESSENYKTLASGGWIPLEGFDGITVSALAVNGKYVLTGQASDELIKAFAEFQ